MKIPPKCSGLFLAFLALIKTTAELTESRSGTLANAARNIRLMVRDDDIGLCHSANSAFEKAHRKGVLRIAELMVTTDWFLEGPRQPINS
jgi:hypothetical protein